MTDNDLELYGTSFIYYVDIIQKLARKNAENKGWKTDGVEDGVLIALMHSELSEALEALRHGNPPSEHIPEFNGAEEEFADVIIRIFDMAESRGYHIGDAVIEKMKFNTTREHRHGGKKF